MKPTLKTMTGVITIVQEGRFRMEQEDGQPILLVLAPSAPIEPQDLPGLKRARARVTVAYEDSATLVAGVVHDIWLAEDSELSKDRELRAS
ncbi:hypothetical protein N825_34570 [Skermanella stibiiresistens SB22]|uniref:Uncharacterized protein n=1 Tax=Skermanella stibiiresistens SB22 TaxID=1385369 RepID=W9HA02_9PROT|nr:hypothetical protein [Skermanella stibiiresistens]EWY40638.1 hypothetical protein N825_34570 [Skermanella stibiiresistens SB22]